MAATTPPVTPLGPRPQFEFPVIHENPNGWGPCEVPEQFKDTPYQPFSKADRLGKVMSYQADRLGKSNGVMTRRIFVIQLVNPKVRGYMLSSQNLNLWPPAMPSASGHSIH